MLAPSLQVHWCRPDAVNAHKQIDTKLCEPLLLLAARRPSSLEMQAVGPSHFLLISKRKVKQYKRRS